MALGLSFSIGICYPGKLSGARPQRSMDEEVIRYVIHKTNSTPLQAKDLVGPFPLVPPISRIDSLADQRIDRFINPLLCKRAADFSPEIRMRRRQRSQVNWKFSTILNFNAGTEFQQFHFSMKLMSGIVLKFHRNPMGYSEFQNLNNSKLNFHAGSLRFERIC